MWDVYDWLLLGAGIGAGMGLVRWWMEGRR